MMKLYRLFAAEKEEVALDKCKLIIADMKSVESLMKQVQKAHQSNKMKINITNVRCVVTSDKKIGKITKIDLAKGKVEVDKKTKYGLRDICIAMDKEGGGKKKSKRSKK